MSDDDKQTIFGFPVASIGFVDKEREAEITRLRAELAAMTARQLGWRRVALMYREQYKEMIAPFGAESDCRTWSKQRREARND